MMAQLFLGFRISEILSLTVGHVLFGGRVRDRITLPPRFLKGGYGGTRSVPVGHELRRALEKYLAVRARRGQLDPQSPLFLSRQGGRSGVGKPLCRSSAEKIIKANLLRIAPHDPAGLSTHTLRKTFSTRVYEKSGHDLLCVRDALGHSSVAVTQVYLPVNRARVDEVIRRSDWTRRRKATASPALVSASKKKLTPAGESEIQLAAVTQPAVTGDTACPAPTELLLPGFETFAA